jgi:hypothetical protein
MGIIEKKDAKLYKNVKHSEKICSVCGGHLRSINFLEGYYAYSLRMGGELCLVVGVRTLPLLRSKHKDSPHSYGLVIYIVLVHDEFCLKLYER